VSRQLDITKAPAVVTVGQIQRRYPQQHHPDSVVLVGTIRTLDPDDAHGRARAGAAHRGARRRGARRDGRHPDRRLVIP
jgi:hypothetical protein